METVRLLADYVATARTQKLTADDANDASRSILDLVAVTASGLRAPGPTAVRATAPASFGAGDVPIWFTGQQASLAAAVWCNTAAAAALDLDDGNRLARGHPGAAIIPAAFAVAQQTGASTEALMKAIVVGYEVGVAVGAARRFYANTGMWSGYGVVAAMGLLRATPPRHLAHAFAIAGASAPNQLHAGAGPAYPAMEGTDVKEGIPWSSVTAIQALLLAEAGHTGPLALLDAESNIDTQSIAAGLGTKRYIARSYFKFHSCCRHVHGPIDALLGLMRQHSLGANDIDAVEVATYSGALRIANRPDPQGSTEIQFSIPYCLGLVALDGPQALLPLTAPIGRPDVIAFARKVSLRLDPELDSSFPAQTLSRVTVKAGGQQFASPVTAPRGEASDPPSWERLEEKLLTVTRFCATPAQSASLLHAIRSLRLGDHTDLQKQFRAAVLL